MGLQKYFLTAHAIYPSCGFSDLWNLAPSKDHDCDDLRGHIPCYCSTCSPCMMDQQCSPNPAKICTSQNTCTIFTLSISHTMNVDSTISQRKSV